MNGRRGAVSGLIRLYPAAWRDRYEEEFLALVEARPPTLGDRFDIVRGAFDARLHPQVRTVDQVPVVPDQRAADLIVARRLGMAALAGAVVWLTAWVVAVNGPLVWDGYGSYRDGSAAYPFIMLSVALLVGGLIGQLIWLPSSARLARAGVIVAIPFIILWAFVPWVIVVFLAAVAGLVVLSIGATRSGAWPAVEAIVVVASLAPLTTLVVLGFGGLISMPQDLVSILAAVFGVPVWLAIGGSLFLRAAPARPRPT